MDKTLAMRYNIYLRERCRIFLDMRHIKSKEDKHALFRDIIEEVRMKNDIVDVISQYVRLTRKRKLLFWSVSFS